VAIWPAMMTVTPLPPFANVPSCKREREREGVSQCLCERVTEREKERETERERKREKNDDRDATPAVRECAVLP